MHVVAANLAYHVTCAMTFYYLANEEVTLGESMSLDLLVGPTEVHVADVFLVADIPYHHHLVAHCVTVVAVWMAPVVGVAVVANIMAVVVDYCTVVVAMVVILTLVVVLSIHRCCTENHHCSCDTNHHLFHNHFLSFK